jgi:hypothetical protein
MASHSNPSSSSLTGMSQLQLQMRDSHGHGQQQGRLLRLQLFQRLCNLYKQANQFYSTFSRATSTVTAAGPGLSESESDAAAPHTKHSIRMWWEKQMSHFFAHASQYTITTPIHLNSAAWSSDINGYHGPDISMASRRHHNCDPSPSRYVIDRSSRSDMKSVSAPASSIDHVTRTPLAIESRSVCPLTEFLKTDAEPFSYQSSSHELSATVFRDGFAQMYEGKAQSGIVHEQLLVKLHNARLFVDGRYVDCERDGKHDDHLDSSISPDRHRVTTSSALVSDAAVAGVPNRGVVMLQIPKTVETTQMASGQSIIRYGVLCVVCRSINCQTRSNQSSCAPCV